MGVLAVAPHGHLRESAHRARTAGGKSREFNILDLVGRLLLVVEEVWPCSVSTRWRRS
jgi:hypothetical protein